MRAAVLTCVSGRAVRAELSSYVRYYRWFVKRKRELEGGQIDLLPKHLRFLNVYVCDILAAARQELVGRVLRRLDQEGRLRQLRAWEEIYNTVRRHQSLGYRTTQSFLRELAHASKG